ncbi:MAG TPA: Ldh family oxidoreductase [bacterium]|nr:Ldh family oxidoreductase [bacterium]
MVTVTASRLGAFASAAFQRVGVPAPDADLVADTLIEADLRGVHSHGVMRLPSYIRRLQAGIVRPETTLSVIREGPAFAEVDGHDGLGQVVSVRAMDLAIDKAQAAGVGFVGVRRSTHFGAAAYYVLRACTQGMIGMAITNTIPLMPPEGGAAAVVGNNPVAYALPGGRERPVVLDMATSVVAQGKIQRAAGRGIRVPLGWGVDRNGHPTDRPEVILDGGMLLPTGGYKGFGLAVVFDLLCGALTGAGWSSSVTGMALPANPRPQNIGHVFMAIDVRQFRPLEEFTREVDAYVRAVHAIPPAPGTERIYVPGEIEFDFAEARRRDGIPLDDHITAGLQSLARELSLAPL